MANLSADEFDFYSGCERMMVQIRKKINSIDHLCH